MNEQTIFIEALQLDSGERDEFLNDACQGNPTLRERIEKLLALHEKADSFLADPAVHLDVTKESASGTESPGAQIGPYKLLEVIGEGGMGVVYMAQQTEPVERRVAVKIIKPGMDSAQIIARFEAERQALAMMDHPNIARVLDAGTTSAGLPYFVMELVKGISITDYCDQHHLPPQQRLELFISVCQAIQHAHQKGVIHRDLKPSNILVAMYDDQPEIKVIDFGVAKASNQRLTKKTMFTRFGQIVGTLEYMSPEQAKFNQLDVDTRSDIYSLGVLLYELLTGTTPFEREKLQSAAFDEIMRMIREEDPPKPSARLSTSMSASQVAANRSTDAHRLGQIVRGDLDWIVMKSLSKDRVQRYATATELAADISRHLQHEPVLAGPPNPVYRAQKFLRKHRGPVVAASVFVLLLIVGIVVSSFLYVRSESMRADAIAARMSAERKRQEAKQALFDLQEQEAMTQQALTDLKVEQDRTQQALEGERQNLYFNRIGLAQDKINANDIPRAKQLLQECPDVFRNWEWRYLNRICQPALTLAQSNYPGDVEFSDDGSKILAPSDHARALTIWNSATGEPLMTYRGHSLEVPERNSPTKRISACAFSPDGLKVASATSDSQAGILPGELNVWDAKTGQDLFSCVGHDRGIYNLAFSPDGKLLASMGVGSRDIKLWNAETGERIKSPKMSVAGFALGSLSFSPDSRRIASGCSVFDVKSGDQLLNLKAQGIYRLVFSPDGGKLAGVANGLDVVICDSQTGEQIEVCRGHRQNVNRVAWSSDGRLVASGTRSIFKNGHVKVWSAETGEEFRNIRGATSGVEALRFSPDGRRLAIASGNVQVFDITASQTSRKTDGFIRRDAADHSGIGFSRNGRRLFGVGVTSWNNDLRQADWQLKIWEVPSGQLVNSIDLPPTAQYIWTEANLDTTADGSLVAISAKESIRIYDSTSGAVRHEIRIDGGKPESIAFSHCERYIAARLAGPRQIQADPLENERIDVWDLETGQQVTPPTGWGFHPNLSRFWNRLSPNVGLSAQPWQVAFSPTSDWRVAWVDGGKIHVRNLFSQRDDSVGFNISSLVTGQHRFQRSQHGLRLVQYAGIDIDQLGSHFAETEPSMVLESEGEKFVGLTFNLAGTHLAACSAESVHVWSLATGQQEPPPPNLKPFCGSAFGPNGEKLLLKSRQNDLRIVPALKHLSDQSTKKSNWYHNNFFGPEKYFAANGRHVVADDMGTAKIWDLVADKTIELKGHGDAMCASFSPDGKRLAIGFRDGIVILWETASWQEVVTLTGHTESVRDLAFTADGNLLATTSVDGTIRLWDARP